MAVEQGLLTPQDTGTDMENYYSDSNVTVVSDVDRGIHNATQFVRLSLQRPQPETAVAFTASGSVNINVNEYLDGSFAAFETTGVSQITVKMGF